MSLLPRIFRRQSRRTPNTLTALWPSVGLRARALILAVVFCVFAPLGVLGEIASTSTVAPTPWLLFEMALVGFCAVVLFELAARSGVWLLLIPVVVLIYLAAGGLARRVLPAPQPIEPPDAVPQALDRELEVGTLAIIVLLYGGYGALLSFLTTEGLRQVRLQTEIALAREIHERLVPPISGRYGAVEVHGVSQPSTEVGGDLFDVHPVDGGVVVYLVDISGHGVSASSLAGMIKSALRMRLGSGDDLGRVVTALHELMIELTPANVYATVVTLRLNDGEGGELCLAGHLPLLRLPVAGSPKRFPADAPPAGLLPGSSYDAFELVVAPGDLFAMYTDGLTEVENADGEQLGVDGLESILIELRARPLDEIHAVTMERVAAHGASDDDQTLVLVRVLQ